MCGILGIVGRPRPESLDAVEPLASFERTLDRERRLIERGVSLPFGGSLAHVARTG